MTKKQCNIVRARWREERLAKLANQSIEEIETDLAVSRELIAKPKFPDWLKAPLQHTIDELVGRLELEKLVKL
jgi:hypothetical protein